MFHKLTLSGSPSNLLRWRWASCRPRDGRKSGCCHPAAQLRTEQQRSSPANGWPNDDHRWLRRGGLWWALQAFWHPAQIRHRSSYAWTAGTAEVQKGVSQGRFEDEWQSGEAEGFPIYSDFFLKLLAFRLSRFIASSSRTCFWSVKCRGRKTSCESSDLRSISLELCIIASLSLTVSNLKTIIISNWK